MPDARFDVVVVGGGHNGLVAAAYLARAGRRVRVLERLDHVGGAAVSAYPFEGVGARLSRYSYLVSLLPRRIIDELGARITLSRRRYSSYTPHPADGGRTGLLVGPESTFASIGAASDEAAFHAFYRRCGAVTARVWPTLTEPLRTRSAMHRSIAAEGGRDAETAWRSLIDRPIAEAITGAVSDDLVRGVMATDALIGTFAALDDESLVQNRCFLYHLIGGGTGDWDVPVGGMGAVTGALAAAAAGFGAEIVTGADVFAIHPDGEVHYRHGDREHTIAGEHVLANVTPAVLSRLLGEPDPDTAPGAQIKVNLVLRRLPGLRDQTVTAEQAFGGTFHVNENFSQLDAAYRQAASGSVPDPLPCEIYCHSLADPTILSDELRTAGAQTLTVFGLHTPHSLAVADTPEGLREELTSAALASVNSVLAEPIHDLLWRDSAGRPCVEAKTTVDLEHTLGMTNGHIFHGGMYWPFADDDEPLDTAAQRWGVATDHPRIMLCGSGSRRGGAVSGIGGHNAAMAVLEG
ncbi:phytoene dehydrogenase-like protein [Mycolicibacterium iranicum]|uniref:Phytoene dehydrogenase-like protein n=1 Tax=Mycolicibacterium iranicum TaxID=912594 RepID=A0A839Q5C1_MYCIR|nr:NAD(P)/FAD-dependent oxidoreductase [Mycolicibacterium iranicum]MBB2990827.1 phytoene dehydrogenase-like protein [Mycolicibacterium iranicum]